MSKVYRAVKALLKVLVYADRRVWEDRW